MARLSRLHAPNGLYYVTLKGNSGGAIFHDPVDYAEFSLLIERTLKRHRCRMHAYCWLPKRVLMAIQIADVRIGRVVLHATSRYVKYIHARVGSTGHLFAPHHHALLVQRSGYLLQLVRYIHGAPVRDGLVSEPSEYAWSGDRAYRETERVPWLTTHVTKEMLSHAGRPGAISYSEWMSQREDPAVAGLFEHGCKDEPRAVGSDSFIATIRNGAAPQRQESDLEEIIATIAQAYGIPLTSLFSTSRRRQLVFVRALIAWRATQCGAATFREVAARLCRDPSALWKAVERYRTLYPELFPERPLGEDDPGFDVAG